MKINNNVYKKLVIEILKKTIKKKSEINFLKLAIEGLPIF